MDLETGIPAPEPVNERDPTTKLGQVRAIPLGQSAFFPAREGERRLWQAAAANVARKDGGKLTTRAVVKNGIEGIRIWRLA
ncbi:hypothetical protein HMPREF9946_02198 [Acetobacteraceae bacterium AT-5844]|nr:hypothetical protein HMPREF9946_02198 [Acetobacteraceae bacterium AT-5844]